ncbi:MAG: phytanoyl-CoA dioxygenase family protein [Rubrivivax sp.]
MSTAFDLAALRSWTDDGYAVLNGFIAPHTLAALRQRAAQIVDDFEPDASTSMFSTRDRSRVADAALLASAEAVHGFLEEDAVDAQGRLQVPKARAVNKIGHALHELDPVFEPFSHGPELARVASAIGLACPQVWQSQLIFKQPRIGGEVGWHQDASFFHTEPPDCAGDGRAASAVLPVTTFWFALEDATLDNGCLWVQPGAHRGAAGVLRERYVNDQGRLCMQPLDATPWPSLADARALPVAAGTLVVFHGLLPHCSAPNRSDRSRLAYTLHATDGRAGYAATNWLQRSTQMPVRGFD